jgi:hypothetical protein
MQILIFKNIQIRVVNINNTFKKEIIMAKYSQKAQDKIETVMHEYKHGKLKSGKGGKGGVVKSRKQAIAIGMSEARQEGDKVPKKKNNRFYCFFTTRRIGYSSPAFSK